MTLRALVFDVDGTLAETEELHRAAFNETFRAFALPWHWDAKLYRELLRIGGGRERLLHYMRAFGAGPAAPAEAADLARRLHAAKTPAYQRLLAEGPLPARPGVGRLIAEARDQGVKLAIATTSARGNVVALVRALFGDDAPGGVMPLGMHSHDGRQDQSPGAEDNSVFRPPTGGTAPGWFAAVAASEDAEAKKPDPAVFRVALERLGLPASVCVAIEDSAIGLRAAKAANLAAVIAPSSMTFDDDFTGALAVVRDLDHGEDGAPVTLDHIRRWLETRG
jgi:beta-phosphoglucomutase-like phosphatase (HAD superfamily)